MRPLFSIIIPSYNRVHILPQAIKSVLCQTYSNWELLIVDDGSTDATGIVVNEFNDNRIHYLYKQNGGVCSARNYGVNFSKGNYIVFLDSDDAVTLDWLEHFNEKIDSDFQQDLICGGLERINLKTNESLLVKPTDQGKGAMGWAVVIPGSFAVKKEFLLTAGLYDEELKYAENTELFFRFKSKRPVLGYTNSYDLKYYPSDDGGSKNIKNRFNSNLYVLTKHVEWFDQKPKDKFVYLNLVVVDGIRLKEYEIALKILIQSIKMKPLHIKSYIRLIQILISLMKNRVIIY